jgi:hypothetical protein
VTAQGRLTAAGDQLETAEAASRERARAEVATWPPLTEAQRETLRKLLDLGGDPDGAT